MATAETEAVTYGAVAVDAAGQITAQSQNLAALIEVTAPVGQHYRQVFGQLPEVVAWLDRTLAAQTVDQLQAGVQWWQVVPLEGGEPGRMLVIISQTPLQAKGQLTAEQLSRIRHDIKNQLGGLKLYTNFLKKRLAGEEEVLAIIEKMDSIVASITQQVSQIRHGEEQ